MDSININRINEVCNNPYIGRNSVSAASQYNFTTVLVPNRLPQYSTSTPGLERHMRMIDYTKAVETVMKRMNDSL